VRVGILCNEYPPKPHGGIGTFTQAFARGLVRAGHRVTVVGIGTTAAEENDEGVRVVTLPRCRIIRGTTELRNRWLLRQWLKAEVRVGRIDIFELPEFDGYLPFPFNACPVVVRLHLSRTMNGKLSNGSMPWKYRLLEKSTLRFHRRWIGVSAWILDNTKAIFGVNPRSTQVIYNPVIPIDVTPPMNTGAKPERYVLFVGYVNERKGALVLAQAAREFGPKHPDVSIVYIGKESEIKGRPAFEVLREEAGSLVSRFVFLGRRSHEETLAWIRDAAIVVLPSRLEAFSMVPLEAMSCGTPMIYTKACSGPEAVQDGITGLLVDPEDPADVTRKVDLLLSDEELAKRLAHQAKLDVQDRFSLERCIEQSLQFYQQQLRRTGECQ